MGRRANYPDAGLLIWHVDNAKYGYGANEEQQMTASQHYCVSVEQADGAFDLEMDRDRGDSSDLFDASSNDAFSDTTLPDAKWWDGSNSGLDMSQISANATDMTFVFGAGRAVGYWQFEGDGSDSSGNGNDLTLHNFSGTYFCKQFVQRQYVGYGSCV